MRNSHQTEEAQCRVPPEERRTYRAWYGEFDAHRIDRPLEALATFRAWYAGFGAAKWDRQLEADVAAGRLDWLVAEARKDRQEGRSSDR
jgi:hypothetical protein